MSDHKNENTTPAPAPAPQPVTKPAAKPTAKRRGGSLAARFDSLVEPKLVAPAELPDPLLRVLRSDDDELREALGLDRVIPAGLLADSELVDLRRVHAALGDLAEQIKP